METLLYVPQMYITWIRNNLTKVFLWTTAKDDVLRGVHLKGQKIRQTSFVYEQKKPNVSLTKFIFHIKSISNMFCSCHIKILEICNLFNTLQQQFLAIRIRELNSCKYCIIDFIDLPSISFLNYYRFVKCLFDVC